MALLVLCAVLSIVIPFLLGLWLLKKDKHRLAVAAAWSAVGLALFTYGLIVCLLQSKDMQQILSSIASQEMYYLFVSIVNGLELSKANDQKVIEWWKSKGRRAWSATDDEDMNQLIDIWLESREGQMVPVDTKYVGCSLDNVWHDTTQGRKSKKLLYCFKKTSYKRCFFVDVDWLDQQVSSHPEQLKYGKQSGSMLYWFSMLNAVATGAAREVDLSGIGLQLQAVLK